MNDHATDTAPQNPHRRRSRRKAVVVVLLAIAAAGGYVGYRYLARDDAAGGYTFATVGRGDVEDLVGSVGSLQPRDYVDVGAQVSGQIEKINVEVGDAVKAGDLLVTIDASSSQAKVDANEASIRSAKANIRTQENALEKSKRDAERQKRLYDQGAATYEAMLTAQTGYEDSILRLEQSKSQLEQQEANARIEASNLRYTKIIAPIAGTVMSLDIKAGQTVNATNSVPKVLRIASLGVMTVQSDVTEADVVKLGKDNAVYFTTQSGGQRRWYSTLKRIEPTPKVSNSVVTYNALFDIPNDDRALMPSMTAQVNFVAAEARNVLVIPLTALQMGQQLVREFAAQERQRNGKAAATVISSPPAATGASPAGAGAVLAGAPAKGSGVAARSVQRSQGTVMVKRADGELEARRIVIGISNRDRGEVVEGLQEGEEVVVGRREPEAAGGSPNPMMPPDGPRGGPPGGMPPGGGFPGGGPPGGPPGGGRPF